MSVSKIVMRLVSISFTVLVFLVIIYGMYQLGLRSYDYGYRVLQNLRSQKEKAGSGWYR